MYSFFVLGIIPGTDIQITFVMWLNVAVVVIAAVVIASFVRRLQQESVHASYTRAPLHATQLHTRFV